MKMHTECTLREATLEDCDLIFEWANEAEVRANSFNSDAIKYEDHVRWYKNKLESMNSIIYILQANYDKVGMVRLDRMDDDSYLVNYSISKDHRQKGYATALLKLIKDKYESSILIGKVKNENVGSIKAFLYAGYDMRDEDGIKVFYSTIKDS